MIGSDMQHGDEEAGSDMQHGDKEQKLVAGKKMTTFGLVWKMLRKRMRKVFESYLNYIASPTEIFSAL
jgi:hypothetical protein